MNQINLRNYVGMNIISLIVALILNFLAVSLPINGKTTGELSDAYPNYFVPAGFTFSIWGIIYTLLIIFVIYQGYQYFKRNNSTMESIISIGPWFLINGIANATWIICWHYEFVLLSLMIMLVLLYSLIKIYTQLHANRPHSTGDNYMILLPFSVYLGWISVATIANVTTVLVSQDWSGWGIDGATWASVMIIIAGLLGIIQTFRNQDLAYTAVIIWAVYGILSKQSISEDPNSAKVAIVAQYTMTLLIIYSVLTLIGRKGYLFENKKNAEIAS